MVFNDDDFIWPIAGGWETHFTALIASANDRLVLCAPYISIEGVNVVARARDGKRDVGRASLTLTDLSPRAVCVGATDPEAVARLGSTLPGSRVVHLPRLHAKVYIADGCRSIVTSGNLTSGGISRNHEYGFRVHSKIMSAEIESDVMEYASLGGEVDSEALARYCNAAVDARAAYAKQITSASRDIQRQLASALQTVDEVLIRARLAGGAMHTVFARTIVFLLRREGALPTTSLHPLVQRLYPDLCDDTVDRVIDGKRFGKKWKHAVRTAQQQLKQSGQIELVDGRWQLVDA